MTAGLLRELDKVLERRRAAALCTIVKTNGSTPLKAGAKMIVYDNGAIFGTIGGGALEHSVIGQAKEIIRTKAASLFEHKLVQDHQMCCGGTVHVYIDPIVLPSLLYIFGAGHIGKALANLAASLDFDVTAIDDRPNIFNSWGCDSAQMNMPISEAIEHLTWDDDTFVVIATYSHSLDRETLRQCLKRPFAYCGMIGSKRKVLITRRLFIEQHWATEEELDRIDMPIGMNISAETPEEIAISIAAGLINARRNIYPSRLGNKWDSAAQFAATEHLCDTAMLAENMSSIAQQ